MQTRYGKLFSELSDAGVEFIVAGGVAAVIQGVERVTLDLDISLDFSPKSVEAFLHVMKARGLAPMVPVDASIIADKKQRRAMVESKNAIVFTFRDIDDPFWHVDVLLLEALSYDALRSSCDSIDIEGREILVLSRRKLLELKKAIDPPRPKDLMDIAALTHLLKEEPL